jgi:hypothetical protein
VGWPLPYDFYRFDHGFQHVHSHLIPEGTEFGEDLSPFRDYVFRGQSVQSESFDVDITPIAPTHLQSRHFEQVFYDFIHDEFHNILE